ncbi:hypothetical protein N1851_003513 [Merluccius polli]|uniref:Alkylated DNA repair protein AlkB homologue 8 N-terminal domain-containing protein n=1 Tax=Merluccius polli TaxID=89951 RepID=A0AA47N9Z4_MERPO|nr:hypothetical protein N1851_003513 [Merluccius polli]
MFVRYFCEKASFNVLIHKIVILFCAQAFEGLVTVAGLLGFIIIIIIIIIIKEIVVDFRRGHTKHPPLTIDGAAVERVSSTKFLGRGPLLDHQYCITGEEQRLYFLRKLKRAQAPPPIMCTFYRGTIESILSSCITVWGGSCTEYSRKALQRIVNTAGKIIGAPLPSLQDTYITRLTRKATSIVSNTSHPAHSLFSLLPSGRRYRSLCARSTRLTKSFIHQPIRKLNSLPSLPPATFSRLNYIKADFDFDFDHHVKATGAARALVMTPLHTSQSSMPERSSSALVNIVHVFHPRDVLGHKEHPGVTSVQRFLLGSSECPWFCPIFSHCGITFQAIALLVLRSFREDEIQVPRLPDVGIEMMLRRLHWSGSSPASSPVDEVQYDVVNWNFSSSELLIAALATLQGLLVCPDEALVPVSCCAPLPLCQVAGTCYGSPPHTTLVVSGCPQAVSSCISLS